MKLVSVIIVNWNGKHYLKDCLESLMKQNYKRIEIVLVDNASKDGSIEFIKSKFPKIKLICNKQNLGFAQANNIGYEHAKGDLILFLNNDTRVTTNFLSEMIKSLDREDYIGGVQGKILLMNENSKLDSVGAFLTNTGFLYHYGVAKKDSPKYKRFIKIYSAKGACMLFKREVLEKIKVNGEIMDSRYFAYFEETDMCHRVWLAGFNILFVPTAVIYHVMGGSSKKLESSFVQYHSFKNRINSYIKNLGTFNLIRILPVHLVFTEAAALIFLLKGKVSLFFAIQSAIWWNLINLPGTLVQRKVVQKKIRKADDGKIFPFIEKKVGLSYYPQLFMGLKSFRDIEI